MSEGRLEVWEVSQGSPDACHACPCVLAYVCLHTLLTPVPVYQGTIDQVANRIYFTDSSHVVSTWDSAIRDLCVEVRHACPHG